MRSTRTLPEHLTLGALRSVATLMVFVGFSAVMPALAMPALPDMDGLLPALGGHIVRFSAVLAGGGLLGIFLTVVGAALFRGEKLEPGTGVGVSDLRSGLLVATLVAVPILLFLQLGSFVAFCRDLLVLLDKAGFWTPPSGANLSGMVMLPIFAILALPVFETLSVVAFTATCVLLLLLVATRSRVLLRATLVSMTLLGALAIASLLGADSMKAVSSGIEKLVRAESAADPVVSAQVLEHITRYLAVTGHVSQALAWAWIALALWIPFLVMSTLSGLRAAAALSAGADSAASAATAPPAPVLPDPTGPDREKFYKAAVRLVDGERPASALRRPVVATVLVVVGLLAIFALVSGVAVFAVLGRLFTR